MFHSFSNTADRAVIIYSGQLHIAVGFCDLGLLTKCTIGQSKSGPVRFLAIDMSAYSVAKSYVIAEMLKNPKISSESVLEVWYSSTWTAPTKSDFQSTLETIIKTQKETVLAIGSRVLKYIEHW